MSLRGSCNSHGGRAGTVPLSRELGDWLWSHSSPAEASASPCYWYEDTGCTCRKKMSLSCPYPQLHLFTGFLSVGSVTGTSPQVCRMLTMQPWLRPLFSIHKMEPVLLLPHQMLAHIKILVKGALSAS